MTGVYRAQEADRLSAAKFAEQDAIRAEPQRRLQ